MNQTTTIVFFLNNLLAFLTFAVLTSSSGGHACTIQSQDISDIYTNYISFGDEDKKAYKAKIEEKCQLMDGTVFYFDVESCALSTAMRAALNDFALCLPNDSACTKADISDLMLEAFGQDDAEMQSCDIITNTCKDTPLTMKIVKNGEKNIISRTCDWAGRKKTRTRCAFPGVAAACPLTCGTCSTCEDPAPSSLSFTFTYRTVNTEQSCSFVAEKVDNGGQDMAEEVCSASDNICRATCGVC